VAETPSLLQVSILLCDWLGQDRARSGRDPIPATGQYTPLLLAGAEKEHGVGNLR
jgi:hypothetical protein